MTRSTGPNPPAKWHGGKCYFASRFVAMMPPHTHYVEPYAGGLAVLFAKDPEGVSEVVNDLHGELVNFWRVLADPTWFAEFLRMVEATPFSEWHWQSAAKLVAVDCSSTVTRAYAFFILCRQSLAGRMKNFTGITKTRTRRGMNNEVSAWLTAVEGLPLVHERLKRVMILNRDALDVIRGQDGEKTLFYCDPPYLHETRVTTSDYKHEMTKVQHIDLLATLSRIKGKFLLSGYRSKLYDDYAYAEGWTRHDFEIANNASGAKEKRRMVECVWCNFTDAA